MNGLISKLLENYDRTDQELLLKAKFLMILTLVVITALIIILVYTCYTFGVNSVTVLTELVGFAIILSALLFLVKGKYVPAVHILFATGFSVAWILMFIEPVSSLLIKIDTIVFIIGLISALPLMFFKTRRPMVVYFIFNYAVFICFNYHLAVSADLAVREHVDYFLDNSIVMIFVFLVSYILFTINYRVLSSLRRLRAFLSSIINSMPSVIIGINKEYEIVMWNNEASHMTGISRDHVLKKNIFDVLPQLLDFKAQIQAGIDTDRVSIEHKITLHCKGQDPIIDMTVYPLPRDDTDGAVIIRIDDISERLQMERVVVQSEKMHSIGGLAAGMAHELNNPLAGMIQSAQVVNNRLSQNFPANDKAAAELGFTMKQIKQFMDKRGIFEQLNNINLAGKRAAKIVGNMLSFARKTDSVMQENNLIELIDDAVELAASDYDLNRNYDFKKVRIEKKYAPDSRAMLKCEKSKIQQVLLNILKNASEAMGMNNCPHPQVSLNVFKETRFVCMEIEDNGPGIDEETRKRIFDPFFTTKSVGNGTGLGLFVSYFIIVEDHDGVMEVESIPGKGTKFIIRLPSL